MARTIFKAKSIPWNICVHEDEYKGEPYIFGMYIIHNKTGMTNKIPYRVAQLIVELLGLDIRYSY